MSDSSAFKVAVLRLLALMLRYIVFPYEHGKVVKRAVLAIHAAEELANKIEEENKSVVT